MANYNESSSRSLKDIIEQYQLKELIGHGTYGQVKLARHRLTDVEVAVKILRKAESSSRQIENEVGILKTVRHKHIIRLYQVIDKGKCVYLVMELATRGNLLGWIRKSRRLYEDEGRRIFKQIVSAVHYLHQNRIAHRDLKPNNILMDDKGNAKVSDFGLSTWFTPGQLHTTVCGAVLFRSPEMFLQERYDACKVDIWSLGILLYFIITGRFPFEGRDAIQVRSLVRKAKYIVPYHLSAKGQNVIIQLLNVDPNQRPNTEQIMEHPWLKQVEECSLCPDEPLPNKLDPLILKIMCVMGYHLHEIQRSIRNRTFNEAMGTYLLIKESIKQTASSVEVKRVPSTVPPCPTPADLSNFPLLKGRTASLPAQLNTYTLSSEFQLFFDNKQLPLKRGLSTTLPAIPLCFLERTPGPSIVPGKDSMVSLGCSIFLSSSERFSSEQPQDETTNCKLIKRRGWRRLASRIANTFRRMCSCVRAQK
ncbi:sperm motility kinase 2B-like [Perognathus longimembris pacificus]|uniref:sperm motility kinase 2B-like n=1 Tax=Perognathus longimembris pacificus TaxID=214514 RepID=UPI002018A32A|nr:sperm motility kinase 2B-like [Perognathus longimembris pacificus]